MTGDRVKPIELTLIVAALLTLLLTVVELFTQSDFWGGLALISSIIAFICLWRILTERFNFEGARGTIRTMYILGCFGVMILITAAMSADITALNNKQANDILARNSSVSTTDPRGSTYTFKNVNDAYSYTVKHQDGSGGEYPLRREGAKLYDTESRFGEYYVLSEKVKVYDQRGFVREWDLKPRTKTRSTAAPKRNKPDSVDYALMICRAADSTGLLSSKCQISGWSRSVNMTMGATPSEARKMCQGMVQVARQEGMRFDGWKIQIYSPFSGDNTIAYCNLP